MAREADLSQASTAGQPGLSVRPKSTFDHVGAGSPKAAMIVKMAVSHGVPVELLMDPPPVFLRGFPTAKSTKESDRAERTALAPSYDVGPKHIWAKIARLIDRSKVTLRCQHMSGVRRRRGAPECQAMKLTIRHMSPRAD